MAKHVLLNNIDHQELKISPHYSPELGDGYWYSEIFPSEFRSVQAHYPIFFKKDDDTGVITPVCLFGLDKEENLFLANNQWQASYIPMAIQRLPFYIASRDVIHEGVSTQERMLTIDLDSPKVNKKQGIDLFMQHGGNSEYLENIIAVLESLHLGLQENPPFINMLITHGLLESVSLEIDLINGVKHNLLGFYTINEDTLAAISSETIVALHQQGFLPFIYTVLDSQVHIRDLIKRKNEKIKEQSLAE